VRRLIDPDAKEAPAPRDGKVRGWLVRWMRSALAAVEGGKGDV